MTMITRDPKVKRLLRKIDQSINNEETKKLAKKLADMLGTMIMDLQVALDDVENKLRKAKR